ncbi:MAG TPA: IPT/TIG domain-containing protein, partial [Acidobacteriota bacterium]|nr:IPT/TIG domain-containing protein [Acidobacteriota bacterium]
VTAQNTTDVSVQARAKLSYETSRGAGTYTLPPIDVPARGSRVLNLKQIILSGTPDENGNVIPPGTTFGTMALEVVNKTSRGLVFGGSTTFDPVKGGYGEFIFPDCSICTFCEDCVVDGYGNSTCQPSCSDPSCCPTPDPSPTLSSITPNHVAIGTTSLNVTLKGSFSSNPHIVIGDSSGQPTSVITVGNLQAPDPQTITATFAITSSATLGTYGVAVQDDGGQSGTIGFSLVPRIDSISPSRGPIGATTAVTISGAGFGTGPTVNAGSGITVTINSASDTQIQASFAISASAAGGNGPVTLTASGQTSDSINFFVQIPTSLSIVAGTSSTTPEASCTTTVAGQPATGCGVTRSFTYQVNDQDTPAQPIEAAGLQVWDAISVTSPNNLGISGVATTCTGTAAGTNNGPCNVTTNSLGQFEETPGLSVCSTVCRVNNACTTGGPTNANQTVHVGPSTITQSPSYYCDHITVNGQ